MRNQIKITLIKLFNENANINPKLRNAILFYFIYYISDYFETLSLEFILDKEVSSFFLICHENI